MEPEKKEKFNAKLTKRAEEAVSKRFPWLKTSLGVLWTLIWLFIAVAELFVVVVVPWLLVLVGIVLLVLVANESGALISLPSFGGKKKEEAKSE